MLEDHANGAERDRQRNRLIDRQIECVTESVPHAHRSSGRFSFEDNGNDSGL